MSMKSTSRAIEVIRYPHHLAYCEAHEYQLQRRDAVEAGRLGNALMLLEHPPVFTLGRKAHREHILQSDEQLHKLGIAVVDVDRGGDVTYHGPGQLVAYPILDLSHWKQSIGWYLRSLEQVLINTLSRYGLEGRRVEGYTGVWVNGAKVAAIGVGLHNWVTYHGIALNVDPNMEHWTLIVPCGIPDKPVTSLKALLGEAPPISEVSRVFEMAFLQYFGNSEKDEAEHTY